jgi:hypothetical protein
MHPCKLNHASSEKNVYCGSISPSTTDSRNQLQNYSGYLDFAAAGCVWITVVL